MLRFCNTIVDTGVAKGQGLELFAQQPHLQFPPISHMRYIWDDNNSRSQNCSNSPMGDTGWLRVDMRLRFM